MLTFERLPQESARDHALRTLKENIIQMELPPGTQIGERELAEQLHLTRMPLREALMELTRVKIMDIQPQKKGVVSLIDLKFIEEACFIRSALECSVVEAVCSAVSEDQLRMLDENIKYQQFCLENHMSDRLSGMDDRFHAMLFFIAEKPFAYTYVQDMNIHFDRIHNMSSDSIDNFEVVRDHIRIVEAIRRRDSSEARKRMDDHLHRVQFDTDAIQNAYPQYFKLG